MSHLVLGSRHIQFPGPQVPAVDPELANRGLHGGQVVHPQLVEPCELVGPAFDAIAVAVGDGRRHETAIAPRSALRDAPALQQHHIEVRPALLGAHSRPQPRQPRSNDDQIGRRDALQGGPGRGTAGLRQPVRLVASLPQCRPPLRRGHGSEGHQTSLRRMLRIWEMSTRANAMKNIAEAITLACAGMPRVLATYTNFGKVVN